MIDRGWCGCGCGDQMVNLIGHWLTFVATMEVGKRMSGGAGMVVAIVLVAQRLPSVVFFPLAGVLADVADRGAVLLHSHWMSAVVVLLFPMIERIGNLRYCVVRSMAGSVGLSFSALLCLSSKCTL